MLSYGTFTLKGDFMAKVNTEMSINVMDIDKVKTLVDLLSAYLDVLPPELKKSLSELADCEQCEIGYDELIEIGHKPGVKVKNSAGIEHIISVNPILRRVRSGGSPDSFPASFSLWSGDNLLVSW